MVRCNLSVILAEQNLRISKVSKDTGISRTTLTSLANNTSQGIQFDTLNTLCIYLQVKPDELISSVLFDVAVSDVSLDASNGDFSVTFTVFSRSFSKRSPFEGIALFKKTHDGSTEMTILIDLIHYDKYPPIRDDIIRFLRSLPRGFFIDIENAIWKKLGGLDNEIKKTIIWNFDNV